MFYHDIFAIWRMMNEPLENCALDPADYPLSGYVDDFWETLNLDLRLNGFSKTRECGFVSVPKELIDIQIAIADSGDMFTDTAIFIREGSLRS